jgi:hypothetical protein
VTVIAALVHEGKVFMGGDSAAVDAFNCVTIRKDPKVFQNGPFLIGFTSSFRMGQILMDAAFPDPGNMDEFEYMRTQFVDVARTRLKDGGYVKVDNNREESGQFLVGFHGRIFEVDCDFQVGEPVDSFCAVGQGSQEALGSLYSTPNIPPVDRLLIAMEASARYRPGVRPPFNIIKEQ